MNRIAAKGTRQATHGDWSCLSCVLWILWCGDFLVRFSCLYKCLKLCFFLLLWCL